MSRRVIDDTLVVSWDNATVLFRDLSCCFCNNLFSSFILDGADGNKKILDLLSKNNKSGFHFASVD